MSQDLGRFLLRLGVGGMLLLHGLGKLRHGIGGVASLLTAHGLPAFLAWGVYLGEVVGPVLLVLGIWTRGAALLCAADMVVAVLLAHLAQLAQLGPSGGWAVELPMLYLTGSVAIFLLGGGRYAAGKGRLS